MTENIQFKLNGRPVGVSLDPGHTLLWVLRDQFGLTGAKFGCGEGLCGACTVLVDEEAVRSCILTMGAVAGKSITTIEGLARNGQLHPIQQAFIDHDALQCGYCTTGMILQAYSLLRTHPDPTQDQIIDGMEDNLCRCGAHIRIVAAIQAAAKSLKGGRP
jgi:aerobic-type carbon monoxide dehydrogenase small subunit (CoxS/CutS family)